MKEGFLNRLFHLHISTPSVPSSDSVCSWLDGLLGLLFPELATRKFETERDFNHAFANSRHELFCILTTLQESIALPVKEVEQAFIDALPRVHRLLEADAEAIFKGDPAANSLTEVIRTYPGFYGIAVHRLAHEFCRFGIPLIPRILSEHAHVKTGIDIHPSATIGERFCIDHGSGIVIGATVNIGNDVKIYQGVTLGALSVKKDDAKIKRHPTIEDEVVIYAGSTILGGNTIIGKGSIIGGNTWIVESVAPKSKVYYQGRMNE